MRLHFQPNLAQKPLLSSKSVAQRRGLRYERKVTSFVQENFPDVYSQLAIVTDFGDVLAVFDLLIVHNAHVVSIIEVKQNFTFEAVQQLRRYEKLLKSMGFSEVRLFCVCNAVYDRLEEVEFFYGKEELVREVSALRTLAPTSPHHLAVIVVRAQELRSTRVRARERASGNLGRVHEANSAAGPGWSGAGGGVRVSGIGVET